MVLQTECDDDYGDNDAEQKEAELLVQGRFRIKSASR